MDPETGNISARASSGRSGAAGIAPLLRTTATITVCGVLPLLTLFTMLVVGHGDGSFADDFHHEIYPQAEVMLDGRNPYPPPDFDPTVAPNFIWPPVVAFVHAPLTLLPIGAADFVMVFLGLALFALALWLVGVADWRVYGVVALWPQVAGEMRVSHLTPALCVLAALAWRTRDARLAPGARDRRGGGAQVLRVAPRRVARGSSRYAAALLATCMAVASLLLVLPFVALDEYVRTLLQLGRGFDQDAYTLFGLVVQAGGSETARRRRDVRRRRPASPCDVALPKLHAGGRRRADAVADRLARLLRPRRACRSRSSDPGSLSVWFLPLATWGMSGAGYGTGDVAEIARLLLVFGVVFAFAFHEEPERLRAKRSVVGAQALPR